MTKQVYINWETPDDEHLALVVQKTELEKPERIFYIEADGTFVLRGEQIAVDKEVADILIECFSNLPPKVEAWALDHEKR